MKITYFGTTMLLFDDGVDQLLFDCHVTRPSIPRYLFGKMATDRALVSRIIEENHMDRLRAIFLSHTHHDHAMDAPAFALATGAHIHGTPSAVNVGLGGGVPPERLHPFGERVVIGGFAIDAIPSLHSAPTLFNNDLGKTIDAPLHQPAKKKDYAEGGSFDFVVTHGGRTCVIRPSFNYIEGQLDGIHADLLFLGVNGMSKAKPNFLTRFFSETIERVGPRRVIPIHWDNFFAPLAGPVRGMPRLIEDTGRSFQILSEYCARRGVATMVQLPFTHIIWE